MQIILRVISGIAKGHKLKTVKGSTTRPTSDMVKESLFNIIAEYVPDARVLDLFAGTGNLGIEALSRGARYAVFVDKSRECIRIIRENLIHTRLLEKAEIIQANSIEYIKKLSHTDSKFDIIFMDPPYNENLIMHVLDIIGNGDIISENGIIAVERTNKNEIPEQIGCLIKFKDRKYGTTSLSFYKHSSLCI